MKQTRSQVEQAIRILLKKYNAECAILFGSYARGEQTDASDIDVLVVGGEKNRPKDIFAFGEELRRLTNRDVDAFELREADKGSELYRNVMREGVRIA